MRIYGWVLWLLPRSFRDEYGEEMRATVEEHRSELRQCGRWQAVRFWCGQVGAVLALSVRLRSGGRLSNGAVGTAWAGYAGSVRRGRRVRPRIGLLGLEVREAMRSLAKRPGSTVGAAVLIAFTIGTAAVVFSLAQGILARDLEWADSERVILIGPRWQDGRTSSGNMSAGEYVEIGRSATLLSSVGAIDAVERTLLGTGVPVEVQGSMVSASVFGVLGVSAALGRTFDESEDAPGGRRAIVLSDALWRGAFGGDLSVLGRSVRLDAGSYEVIGVMPPGFELPTEVGDPDPSVFYLPLGVDPADPGPIFVKDLNGIIGRLRPGAERAQATAELERIAAGIVSRYPDNYDPEWTLEALSPVEKAVAGARPTLRMLLAAVGFLVLAVCGNLGSLLASRGVERRPELAVRSALGAGRLQIVRRVVVEAVLLAGAGGLSGVLLAAVSMPSVRTWLSGTLPRVGTVELSRPAVAVSLLAVLATAMLFSAGPALVATRAGASRAVRGAVAERRRGRFQRLGITVQLGMGALLLCASVLFVRSLVAIVGVDPGFHPAGVQTVELSLPASRYSSAALIESFYGELVRRLEASPGVQAAGLVRRRPMADRYGTWTVAIRGGGEPRRLDDDPPRWQVVTPGYLRALSIDIEEGNTITDADASGPVGVVLVNAAFARRHWPGRSAVGTEVRMDGGRDNPWLRVAGVVADVQTEGPRSQPEPVLYVPHSHFAAATSTGAQRSMSLVLRTAFGQEATRRLVESVLSDMDPELPHGAVRSMDDIVASARSDLRLLTQVLSLFAVLALALGVMGVYGGLAYDVSVRAREIGIRSALGADRTSIIASVVREGLGLATTGIAIGVGAALLLAGSVGRYLFDVDGRDPLTYGVVSILLLLAAVSASWVPARRAASADPLLALRAD